MLARITGSHGNGVKRHHFFNFYTFRYLLQYSTSATQAAPTLFLVDFLVNSLGFSREEAVSTSNKVNRLKPSNKPELVINFFNQSGFDNTQIKKIVSKSPRVLFSNVDRTLKPKLVVLQELGLSGSELVDFVLRNEYILHRGVDTFIRPSLDYLKDLLGSTENVVKVIKKCSWVLSCNTPKKIAPNVSFLQNIGFSDEKIRKFILQNPRYITQSNVWLKDVVLRVERDFGIPRESAMFFYGLNVIASFSQSSLAKKVAVYKSFGWADTHLRTMARNLPLCFSLSEAKICKHLTFLMKDLGCTSEYLASRPKLLMYSLEKRVIPRHRVLTILNDRNFKRKLGLYTAVSMNGSQFMKELMLPYKDKIPNLYESYIKSIK